MVSKGQIVGIDWNRIARLHSHVRKKDCIFAQRSEELPKLPGQSQVRKTFCELKENDRVGLTS